MLPISHGLKYLRKIVKKKPKPFLFINWLFQVICYSMEKLTNPETYGYFQLTQTIREVSVEEAMSKLTSGKLATCQFERNVFQAEGRLNVKVSKQNQLLTQPGHMVVLFSTLALEFSWTTSRTDLYYFCFLNQCLSFWFDWVYLITSQESPVGWGFGMLII